MALPFYVLGNIASRPALAAKSLKHAERVIVEIDRARSSGATSLHQIAAALNERGVQTPRGSTRWHAKQVSRVLSRAGRSRPI